MKVDYHIHTSLCGHAQGQPREYALRARELGMDEIGFADHFPLEMLEYTPEHPVTMTACQLPEYIAAVQELTNQFDFPIRLGVEADIIPGREKLLSQAVAKAPFDYIIGSLHFLGDWDFTHPAYRELFWQAQLQQTYQDYFEVLGAAAAGGVYDIIGHPDGIKKFGFQPPSDLGKYYRHLARQLRRGGTCLELNTSGLDAPAGEAYPALGLLKACRAEGVPVTLGSDAHRPEDVGRRWKTACRLLDVAGYQEVALFRRRQLELHPLIAG